MSSSDIAISVRGIGKAYTIRHRSAPPATTMAEAIVRRLRQPFAREQRETFWALKDVSFDVKRGEVVGIIGRNGAGKSTLLKILSRITEMTEGEADLYGRVGSLLEVGTGFHQELTGRENIFLNGAILGMTRTEIRKHFDEIVDFAGVEKFLDTPVKRYSSGMYVRLAFAVAAHLRSEILIVDEVLAVGDGEFQKKCLDKMKAVTSDGRTVLFVSHNMKSIEQLCTSCAVLQMGRLLSSGPAHESVASYLNSTSSGSPVRAEQRTRKGSGEYRICSAEFDRPAYRPEETKTLRFRISRCSGSVGRLFVVVHFVDSDGAIVFRCDSRAVNADVEDNAGIRGELRIKSPWLKPGGYRVDLQVISGALIDELEDACRCEIVPLLPYSGTFVEYTLQFGAVLPEFEMELVPEAAASSAPELASTA